MSFKNIKNQCKYTFLILISASLICGGAFLYFSNKEEGTQKLWKEYSNPYFGLSFKIPKKVYGLYKCVPNKTVYVPVKVLEDYQNRIIHITQAYYYKPNLDDNSQEPDRQCKKSSTQGKRNHY